VIPKVFFVEFSLQPCDYQFFLSSLPFRLCCSGYDMLFFIFFFSLVAYVFDYLFACSMFLIYFFPPFHLRFFELFSMVKILFTLFHCQLSSLKVCHGVHLMHRLHVIEVSLPFEAISFSIE
jgi:hypothetical protein